MMALGMFNLICLGFVGDSGAFEMSWVDVPGDKLFEPIVTMVGRNCSIGI